VRRVVVVGIGIVVAVALLSASAEAKGRRAPKPKPDLKVTRLETDLGDPGFAIVRTDGVLDPIKVTVEIRNHGNAAAPASTAVVFFQDSSRHQFLQRVKVPPLKAQQRFHVRFVTTVDITGAKPSLGFAQMGAMANYLKNVKESDESNNLFKGQRFAIVAKEWDATKLTTTSTGPVANLVTSTREGFRFVFSSFDGQYNYMPYGSVDNKATETGVCSGTSDETRTHNPWSSSYLRIDADLGGYDALVKPSAIEMYSITITCLGIGSHTEEHSFQPLETFVGVKRQPAMTPSDQVLVGDGMDTTLGTTTTWEWEFKAKLG